MSEVSQTRLVSTPQVAEPHQENQPANATTALGCVVAPDSTATLAGYRGLAAQVGLSGFEKNLSERQQLYYGKLIAEIVERQARGEDMSEIWRYLVYNEIPRAVTDSAGRSFGEAADITRVQVLIGMGALGGASTAVGETLARISRGESHPHRNDGSVFRNDQKRLPKQAPGYYREYVVPTKGNPGPGTQRVVIGKGGEVYYTANHYRTFTRVPVSGGVGKRPGAPGGG